MTTEENNNEFNAVKDHIKIKISQTAKGARIEVTLDREDHNIDLAVQQAVEIYKKSIEKCESENLKVEDYKQ